MLPAPVIRKLDETVINRIAAGEVIQRPANALKEMLENSLDAGSTVITVTAKQGGLKLLQIQDNGSGIRKDDLDIVCERFTTSKLAKFEDLLSINTYGFRGEALSSISHVAHLTIITKTADSAVGYKAAYEDGKLKGPPKPCAALQGTQIRVEDVFYNVATRRKALKVPSEEYAKILEVVSRYAIHNYNVSFTLKKEGDNNSDVKTPVNSSVLENIRLIFGSNIANDVMEVSGEDAVLKFKVSGYVTNVNYSDKKFLFLLFINHRLVDSSAIKKVIDQVYSTYLPKGSHPFAYLSIELNPCNVDVNVHPTKHEVHFLHEEAIIDKLRAIVEAKLTGSNSSRSMYTQAKLPTNFKVTVEQASGEVAEKKLYAHELVRVDVHEQKIDKFFKEVTPGGSQVSQEKETPKQQKAKRNIKLRSVLQLRTDVINSAHKGLTDFIKNFFFVGVVSPNQCLLQNDTKLYLCSTEKLVTELLYQVILFDFANFGVIKFSSPIPLTDLAMLFLDADYSGWTEEDGPKTILAEGMASLLQEKCVMLEDYFSIEIEDKHICSLPLLLEEHIPNMALLPDFIVRVCTEVDWNLEQPCLEGISRELARFYCHVAVEDEECDNLDDSKWKRQIEHVLMPGVKATLLPPAAFATDGTLLEIANLPDLYRVFERC